MKNLFKTLNKKDYFNRVNLHIHSLFSDGKESVENLIKQAKIAGLDYYSITDHNTVEGYNSIAIMPKELIAGIEFDCYMDFNLPHILGYGIDINNKDLLKLTRKFKSDKFEIPRRIITSRSPKIVIEAIHSAGGIAVLAHPCCYWCFNLDRFIEKLKNMGLDGVEVYYPYDRLTRFLTFHTINKVEKIAEKYDLIKTGGKDSHGSLI